MVARRYISKQLGRIVLIVIFIFSIGITARLWFVFNQYKALEGSNSCSQIEGAVQDLILGVKGSSSFTINGVLFQLPGEGTVSYGYRISDSEINNGDWLRLCYAGRIVLRVEREVLVE